MDKLEPPGVLSLTGNVAENWKKFKQRFDVYMTATGASEKGDKQKACIFLHVVGEEAVQVYDTFVFDDGDEYKLKKYSRNLKHIAHQNAIPRMRDINSSRGCRGPMRP